MIDSRAERWRLAAAISIVCAAVSAPLDFARAEPSVATNWRLAQVGPPIKLERPPRRERTEPPVKSEPAADPAPIATPAGEPVFGRTGTVEVDTLDIVDPDSVGLLDPSQGGFGADLWKGTRKALVERLLPKLATATPSRFSRDLMLKLLLSRAPAPRSAAPGAAETVQGSRSLLTLRVERLLALAEVESAVKLLRLAPAETAGEAHARVEVDSLFYQNDNPGACAKVRGFVRQYRGGFWQQANAFCLALAGDHARSSMVADILREREADIGSAFFTLVDALGGDERAVVESLPDPGALRLAMMRAANRRLPDDAIASGRPNVLRAVSLSPNADLALRLDAAERAFAVGALSITELTELYGAVEFSPEQLANPLTAAETGWGPRARALLLRAAAGADQGTARAEILRRAWDLSREKGSHAIMLGASVPVLATIEPAAGLIWFAADAARTLFGTGMTIEAMAWYRLAESDSKANEEARRVADALWPLALIADDQNELAWRPDGLAAWQAATKRSGGDGAAARRRALMVYSVLQALGKPVGPGEWTKLLGAASATDPDIAPAPDAALWHALGQASEQRQLGLTVLLTLLALGESGAGAAHPLTVSKAIVALESVGLGREARGLALEAVSGTGS